ncbi:MAG: family 16 glycosylhydrolase [Anaerolineaceae bacterium]|nr:family 16 glycosylhydrolase [Anaerolineaceae bacterium]
MKSEQDYQLTDARLVWSDEFDQDQLTLENWTYATGGHGWGNGEWEYYTDRPENVRVENGKLVIEVREEEYEGRGYTSGRIMTRGLRQFQYGRFEARIKLPYSQGIWPAFWMMGSTNGERWPDCGEIDIMEHIGREPKIVHGTIHGPKYAGAFGIGAGYEMDANFEDDFHTFAIEWIPDQIQWFVDGHCYHTIRAVDLPGGVRWPFDHEFYLLLNVAVGGSWPDYPDETTVLPQKMLVDYVRVYQADTYPEPIAQSRFVLNQNTNQMLLAHLSIEPVDLGDSVTAAEVYVTIHDPHQQPVEGVTVRINFTGLVNEGDGKLVTDQDGIAGPFRSVPTRESGAISAHVKNFEKEGWMIDVFHCVHNTITLRVGESK